MSGVRTKTWPELSKWYSLLQFDCLREMFVLEATSIHSTEPGHERTWRIDAIPWSERNTEAFAGLHNAGKRVILLFDEASSIIDAIWDTASGGLTDAGTEILWLAYGNPTRNTGRFHQAIVGRFRNQWRHRMIDGRNVKRTNKDLLAKWVETYGEDSDFVRVRVKGQFPWASSAQFIPSDLVQGARKREAQPRWWALPSARDGEWPVPFPRWQVAGCAEGQSQCLEAWAVRSDSKFGGITPPSSGRLIAGRRHTAQASRNLGLAGCCLRSAHTARLNVISSPCRPERVARY